MEDDTKRRRSEEASMDDEAKDHTESGNYQVGGSSSSTGQGLAEGISISRQKELDSEGQATGDSLCRKLEDGEGDGGRRGEN